MLARSVLILLLIAFPVNAQTKDAESALIRTTAARIAVLTQQSDAILQENLLRLQREATLRETRRSGSPPKQQRDERFDGMENVTNEIHATVDAFLSRIDIAEQDYLQAAIATILGDATAEAPGVFVAPDSTACPLAVAYALKRDSVMGPGSAPFTLRCYRRNASGFELAAETGGDMAGYASLRVCRLQVPVGDDEWFLVTGRPSSANGPNTRSRIYLVMPTGFQTVWAPANIWADLTFTPTISGFQVSGPLYREDTNILETYIFTDHGVERR